MKSAECRMTRAWSFYFSFCIHHSAFCIELVEPEVVATSPYPIKSRVPVYCGFSSKNWWAREDLHLQGSQILDLWGLLFPLNHSPGNWCSQPESRQQPQPSEGCALIF